MSGGQHRIDEVTRTGLVGWIGTTTRELWRVTRPSNKRDRADVGVCAKEIKTALNTLDGADFVRDVDKSSSHQLSQNEIAGDNPCSRQLSGSRQSSD
jgi:hypothetical protein